MQSSLLVLAPSPDPASILLQGKFSWSGLNRSEYAAFLFWLDFCFQRNYKLVEFKGKQGRWNSSENPTFRQCNWWRRVRHDGPRNNNWLGILQYLECQSQIIWTVLQIGLKPNKYLKTEHSKCKTKEITDKVNINRSTSGFLILVHVHSFQSCAPVFAPWVGTVFEFGLHSLHYLVIYVEKQLKGNRPPPILWEFLPTVRASVCACHLVHSKYHRHVPGGKMQKEWNLIGSESLKPNFSKQRWISVDVCDLNSKYSKKVIALFLIINLIVNIVLLIGKLVLHHQYFTKPLFERSLNIFFWYFGKFIFFDTLANCDHQRG